MNGRAVCLILFVAVFAVTVESMIVYKDGRQYNKDDCECPPRYISDCSDLRTEYGAPYEEFDTYNCLDHKCCAPPVRFFHFNPYKYGIKF